jgi:hypothetical protein
MTPRSFIVRSLTAVFLLVQPPTLIVGLFWNRDFRQHKNGDGAFASSTSAIPAGDAIHTSASQFHVSDDEQERRWNDLMKYCQGNWSGSIGWLDVVKKGRQRILTRRRSSRTFNMRLSFLPSTTSNSTAHWVVYHARRKGSREEVTLNKRPTSTDPSSAQLFYSFDEGIIGRAGKVFNALPVIEHGFWDRYSETAAMRRTIVIIYCTATLHLQSICFLQQRKDTQNSAFDVAGYDSKDIRVLPKRPAMNLQKFKKFWRQRISTMNDTLFHTENISWDGTRERYRPSSPHESLDLLLGNISSTKCSKSRKLNRYAEDDGKVLRALLPNRIILACPWCLQGLKTAVISLGCARDCGQLQVVNFHIKDMKLQNVKAYWSHRL